MRRLANLLGNDHPLFIYNIAEMERATGHAGVDTRLLANITEKAHHVLRRLGLDTADTTSHELYHALNSTVANGSFEKLLQNTPEVLLSIGDEIVSFNVNDVVENAHHGLSFESRSLEHARRHLRAEIIKRYAAHERTHNRSIHQLAEEGDLKPDRDSGHTKSVAGRSPSLLAIGDIFTDAFIKLDVNYAKIEKDKDGNEWLKLPYGSKPPYDRVDIVESVGPSPNAAISCKRLGLDVALMSWLGDDKPGEDSLAHLRSEGIDVSQMITEKGMKSNYWYVLRHGADRTMLVKSESYKYDWKDPAETPDWLYLAYIGKDSWQFHEDLANYLERNSSINFVFQPATYHFEWGPKKLKRLYKRSNLVVMNREEAVQVTGGKHSDVKSLAKDLHNLGPEKVVITDGKHGSYAFFNNKLVSIKNYPDIAPPLDRTGAGDAFASTIVAALALGQDMETALKWAPINSMNVVQYLGAQKGLQTRKQVEKWLEKAPKDYEIKKL